MRVSEVHAAESVAYLNRALFKLQDIWEEIGISEDQRLQRTNVVHEHIKDLLGRMIVEEEELKKRVLKNIESCRKEISQLCSELQMPPLEEEDGCTMLQMEKNSRTRLELMKEHKRQRMEDLKSLVVKDRELCDIMCTTPFSINQETTPSLKQLEDYRAYMDELTKEKEHRHEEFVSIMQEINTCMDDLERQAETSFEKDVMCEDEEAFCLSTDNINALKQLLSQLRKRKAENEELCAVLRTKLQELWDRLKIPLEEREDFSEHMLKSKRRNIEALQAEVQRFELLKLHSMKSVIEAIRAEISLYWETCFYSQEQREAFLHYHDDDFTEELLKLHEDEVKTLKSYFEGHKELFEGVAKWQENWAVYLELDRKANDTSRFNNRGGNLLKEEKQRSDLQKSLPKQLKRSKQTQEDMLYGTAVRTPSKRRIAGTLTPSKQRKMGMSTMSTPNSFLSSGFGGTMGQSSIQKPPLSASKGLGLRTAGHAKTPRALDRNKENLDVLNRNTPCGALRSQDTQDCTITFNCIASSYSEFSRDLSKASQSNVNSRLLNSTVSQQ
ncbi:protein regulator of cytokinesis 1-like isoform X3 [Phycodurus eques]|uniref:protein regulator of cytokinesis 1-like isoform X3 n=1 Tax=Phycodurus eques TaxID=693459 RepID=UPI002ACD2228|nr:protein regulator of cytokinesis 1-like isoform X3 [Phycodurus eques]